MYSDSSGIVSLLRYLLADHTGHSHNLHAYTQSILQQKAGLKLM